MMSKEPSDFSTNQINLGNLPEHLQWKGEGPPPAKWEAIPRGLLPRLNGRFGRGYDSAPQELKPSILLTAKIEHKAKNITKKTREAAE